MTVTHSVLRHWSFYCWACGYPGEWQVAECRVADAPKTTKFSRHKLGGSRRGVDGDELHHFQVGCRRHTNTPGDEKVVQVVGHPLIHSSKLGRHLPSSFNTITQLFLPLLPDFILIKTSAYSIFIHFIFFLNFSGKFGWVFCLVAEVPIFKIKRSRWLLSWRLIFFLNLWSYVDYEELTKNHLPLRWVEELSWGWVTSNLQVIRTNAAGD